MTDATSTKPKHQGTSALYILLVACFSLGCEPPPVETTLLGKADVEIELDFVPPPTNEDTPWQIRLQVDPAGVDRLFPLGTDHGSFAISFDELAPGEYHFVATLLEGDEERGRGTALATIRADTITTLLILIVDSEIESEPKNDFRFTEKLIPSDGRHQSRFGHRVVVDGDTMIVADPTYSVEGTNKGGVVSIYEKQNDGTWQLQQELFSRAKTRRSGFGYEVKLDGNTLVVVDRKEYTGERESSADIYTKIGDTWVFEQAIADPGAMDLSGDVLAIVNGGDVAIFRRSPKSALRGNQGPWVVEKTIQHRHQCHFEDFSREIPISAISVLNNRIAITKLGVPCTGRILNDYRPNGSLAVYLFLQKDWFLWKEVQRDRRDDIAFLSMSDTHLAAYSLPVPWTTSPSDKASLDVYELGHDFESSRQRFEFDHQFEPRNRPPPQFLDMTEDTIAVGMTVPKHTKRLHHAVQILSLDTKGKWDQTNTITRCDVAQSPAHPEQLRRSFSRRFGTSVSLDDSSLAIGAPVRYNGALSSVYVYDRTGAGPATVCKPALAPIVADTYSGRVCNEEFLTKNSYNGSSVPSFLGLGYQTVDGSDTIDGQNVTACAKVDFGRVTPIRELEVVVQAVDAACGAECRPDLCGTGQQFKAFHSINGEDFHFAAQVDITSYLASYFVPVEADLRYALICRSRAGSARAHLEVDYIEALPSATPTTCDDCDDAIHPPQEVKDARGRICNQGDIFEEDGYGVGLAYATADGFGTIDGQNVTGCVHADFGKVSPTHSFRLVARGVNEACGLKCTEKYCGSGHELKAFSSSDGRIFRFLGKIALSEKFASYTAPVHAESRYALICRSRTGSARDHIELDYVESLSME